MSVKTMWSVAQSAMWAWWNDNCMRLSASLAFYTALSLAPLVILVVGVAGLITERQQVANQLEQEIEFLIGPSSRQLVNTILTTTEPQGGMLAAIIGIVTLAIGATAVFGELQAALNLIWEIKPKPISGVWANLWDWLRQRFFSLAIVFSIAFLLLVSLVISAALAGVAHYFQGPALAQTLLSRGLETAVSILVITLLFALLFRYVPDAEIHWHDVWLAACRRNHQGARLSICQRMQPLQIESETHQTPLTRGRLQTAQRELAKSKGFFDDTKHRLDRAFA
jgi:membrane protein